MRVSDIIKEIMSENTLTQAELADILCVSQRAVSNWINEVALPNANNILSIYENFGITPSEVLGVEEPRNFKLLNKKK